MAAWAERKFELKLNSIFSFFAGRNGRNGQNSTYAKLINVPISQLENMIISVSHDVIK